MTKSSENRSENCSLQTIRVGGKLRAPEVLTDWSAHVTSPSEKQEVLVSGAAGNFRRERSELSTKTRTEMAENLLRSKLKRRKVSTEGQRAEVSSSGTLNRSHSAAFFPRKSAQPQRFAVWLDSGGFRTSSDLIKTLVVSYFPTIHNSQR